MQPDRSGYLDACALISNQRKRKCAPNIPPSAPQYAATYAFDLLELDGEDLRPDPLGAARPGWRSCSAVRTQAFN
jgi:hypothetical protein